MIGRDVGLVSGSAGKTQEEKIKPIRIKQASRQKYFRSIFSPVKPN